MTPNQFEYIMENEVSSCPKLTGQIRLSVCDRTGFKAWDSMESTIAGYELINMIKKGQHINAGKMTVWDQFYAIAA